MQGLDFMQVDNLVVMDKWLEKDEEILTKNGAYALIYPYPYKE